MGESDLREDFLRFRDHGDVNGFARVFDRTAPDLLELARRLSPSRSDSDTPEDLVQATFVVAIEKRRSFDESRPLEPWLAGILAHHALAARRRARRAEAVPLDAAPPTFDSAVEDRELWKAVERATADLPPAYRDLVAARVFGSERPRDAASRAGRSAGVVRMQLHRGLSLLRRALPKGLLASFALTIDSRISLGSARDAAIARAREIVAIEPLAAPTVIGGIVVSKKLVFAIAAIAVAWVGAVLFRGEPNRDAPRETTNAVLRSEEAAAPAAPTSTETDDAAAMPAPEREAADVSRGGVAPTLPDAYRRALSGVRGRLIEASGAPASFLEVTLLAFDRDRLALSFDEHIASPPLDSSVRTRTDADGRFRFTDLEPALTFGLGIDLGGPRATMKWVDTPLASGEESDLGDIRLGAVIEWTGRVVDDAGAPVARARVRATPIPGPIAALGFERVTPDALWMNAVRNPARIEPLPPWLRSLLRDLPIPTTFTEDDGRFALRGVAPGLVTTIVDHARFTTRAFGPFPSRKLNSVDVGDLELSPGRTIEGIVVDDSRRPVEGVEVAAGTTGLVKSRAILERRTTTDRAGRFVIHHVADEGDCVIAVRRDPTEAWSVHNGEPEVLEIVLSRRFRHTVSVSDESGAPVLDAEFKLCPERAVASKSLVDRNEEWSIAKVSTERLAPGEYVLEGLSLGGYAGIVTDSRGAGSRFEFVVEEESTGTTIVLHAPRSLTLEIVDAKTQAPIEHALARVLSSDDPNATLARARSDRNGICSVPLTLSSSDARFALAVEHPRYATRLERVETTDEKLVIALDRGGELIGRLTVEGSRPVHRNTILISSPGETDVFAGRSPPIPIVLASNEHGLFAAHRLIAGNYFYEIYDDLLGDDLSTLASRATTDRKSLEPKPLARGGFSIVSGETTELAIDLSPPGSARNGTIEGRVTSGDLPLTTASVHVDGSVDRRFHPVDADGRYVIRDVPPGDVEVQVYDFAPEENGSGYLRQLLRKKVQVVPGGVAVADFRLARHPLRVFVRDRGAVAPHVMVELQRITSQNVLDIVGRKPTGDDGGVEIAANDTGEYRVIADDPARGFAIAKVEVRGDGLDADLHLDLDPGITVAGKVELAEPFGVGPYTLVLVVRAGEGWLSRELAFDPKVGTYRFPHVPSGELRFILSDVQGRSLYTSAVGDRDREDLAIVFEPE